MLKYKERYTDEQQRILAQYFTSTDGNVFVLRDSLSQTTKAALFGRYSRSSKSMRTLFLDEFVRDPNTGEYHGGLQDHIDALEKASKFKVGGPRSEAFFRRVFSEYGDDSVIDSASAHIALEGVDQVEAKYIEDGRLAGYIEKSTRFVDFTGRYKIDNEGYIAGKSDNGSYLYKEYPEIMASSLGNAYRQTMDLLFSTVKTLQEPVADELRKRYPLDGFPFKISINGKEQEVLFSEIEHINGIDIEAEKRKATKAYNSSVKAASFDVVRVLLPMSTMTNIGWHSSYRTADHSLVKMLSYDYPPILETADSVYNELAKENEPLISRVKDRHGTEEIKFLKQRDSWLRILASRMDNNPTNDKEDGPDVRLFHNDTQRDALVRVAAATLYPYTNLRMRQIMARLKSADRASDIRAITTTNHDNAIGHQERMAELPDLQNGLLDSRAVIRTASAGRSNRRHKPPRSFELANYDVELVGNIGIFRDLQRNRFTLQTRQRFGISNGYDTPRLLIDIGLDGKFKDAIEAVQSLYKDVLTTAPKYAEACVTLAHRVRWIASADLRQFIWMLELRTGPQGHPDYRKLMQKTYQLLRSEQPSLVNRITMKFVDSDDYPLGRLAALHRTEGKLEKLG